MAVWDELRVILTRLRDDHPSPLLQWPDPRDEEGQPPPYQITLAPSAAAVAEDLHERFGEAVVLTVGCLPYPPGRQPDRPVARLTPQPPGELLNPLGVRAELDGPATVRSRQTLRHGLLVRNLTSRQLMIATNGQGNRRGGRPADQECRRRIRGAQTLVGVTFPGSTGATERIHC
jgi:hypothetical protein